MLKHTIMFVAVAALVFALTPVATADTFFVGFVSG